MVDKPVAGILGKITCSLKFSFSFSYFIFNNVYVSVWVCACESMCWLRTEVQDPPGTESISRCEAASV